MMDNANSKMPDGFNHQACLSIDSTNKEAVRQIMTGAVSGLWITAEEQTSGRGRSGREWVSNSGNLFSTLVYETGKSLCHSAQLSFVTSLAVRDTVEHFTIGADVKCKWPNDVLVNGAKISGILLETFINEDGTNFMIIGIGINVNHHPDKPLYPAAHINKFANVAVSDVFQCLAKNMSGWLNVWQNYGFEKIRHSWLNYAKGQGDDILVRLPNEELNGRFVDLDGDGALMLDTGTEIKLIHSGDVFFPDVKEEK
ncbi:MAG: biotin--[acetyl-CoA-carboxylase] ligase [Emcibacteraceae bacterium]|nr:biotin--[acetyl-CoA-carboxylase] ligase [Emcibacteraceae bacterium]